MIIILDEKNISFLESNVKCVLVVEESDLLFQVFLRFLYESMNRIALSTVRAKMIGQQTFSFISSNGFCM